MASGGEWLAAAWQWRKQSNGVAKIAVSAKQWRINV